MGIILGKDLNKLHTLAFMCLPLFKFFVLPSFFHGALPPPSNPCLYLGALVLVRNLFIARRLQNTGER